MPDRVHGVRSPARAETGCARQDVIVVGELPWGTQVVAGVALRLVSAGKSLGIGICVGRVINGKGEQEERLGGGRSRAGTTDYRAWHEHCEDHAVSVDWFSLEWA